MKKQIGHPTTAAPDTNNPADRVLIQADSFKMGDSFNEGGGSELPAHKVQLSSFYIDKHEVTKGLWDEVKSWAEAHGYRFDHDGSGKAASHPVHSVNWYDVVKWCNARSEKERQMPAYYTDMVQTTKSVYRTGQVNVQNDWVKWASGYRLPTEAEWEMAARGGSHEHRFPWSDVDTISQQQANYKSEFGCSYDICSSHGYHPDYKSGSEPHTSPVGSFAPNGHGIFDMAGNVHEWCWDWYGAYSGLAQIDPHGPASGLVRVFRGGSWDNDARVCRVVHRDSYWPDYASSRLGFRTVLNSGK